MKVYRWENSDGIGPMCGLARPGFFWHEVFNYHIPPLGRERDLDAYVISKSDLRGANGRYSHCFAALSFDWLIDLTVNCKILTDAGFSLKEFEVNEDYMIFDKGRQIIFNRDLAVITDIIESA